jgi:hypothetical protein
MLASPKPNSTLISRIFRKTLYSMEKVSFFCLVAIAGPVNAQNTTTAWSAAVRTAAGEPIAGAKVTVPRLRRNNKQLSLELQDNLQSRTSHQAEGGLGH